MRTKFNLEDEKFGQSSGSTLTLSGETQILGTFRPKYVDFLPQTGVTHQTGRFYYDNNEKTFIARNDISDVSLNVGEEMWARVENLNAYTLLNGKVGYVRGSSSSPIPNLDCDYADASNIDKSTRTLGLFTNDILAGEQGYLTRYGAVRDMDTSAWSVGDILYLDADTPGDMTNVKPAAPNYPVRIGIVIISDASFGMVGVDTLAFNGTDTNVNSDGAMNGIVTYTPNIEITVTGSTIYADVTNEEHPTLDLPFLLGGDRYLLNTTTNTGAGGAARIVIPPGLSTIEKQVSYLYIVLNVGVPTLTITTTPPVVPFANLATFVAFNAARTVTDGRLFAYRRANNAVSSEVEGLSGAYGIMTVALNAIRFKLGSNWLLGQDATPTVNDTTIRVSLTAGVGAQLHVTDLPSFDGTSYLIYNTDANVVTYETSTNLTDITLDANGGNLLVNLTYYTIRLYYQLNSDGIGNNIIATRPLGSYATAALAIDDPSNYTVSLSDTDIEEVVYPLYDIVIGRTGGGGATITLEQLTDLRSKLAGQGGTGGGTGGGASTDDKVRITANDTATDYLNPKIAQGDGLTFTILNPSGNEQLQITSIWTTVGTTGDYGTIQLALAAGRYNLQLISNVTETVDWGVHSSGITIFSDAHNIINLSTSNTSALSIFAKNISFSVTGTSAIFTTGSTLFLSKCSISGDTSRNDFGYRADIYADELYIDTGNEGFNCYLADVKTLYLNGGGALAGNESYVTLENGTINRLEISGTFIDYVNGANDAVIKLINSTVHHINDSQTSAGAILCENSKISKGLAKYIVINDDDNIFQNLTISNIMHLANTGYTINEISNCEIQTFSGDSLYDITTFNNNRIFTGTIAIDHKIKLFNSVFFALQITASDCDISGCECVVGTITVDATVTRTNIIGCRVSTSVVDNGTDTNLIATQLIV